MHVTFVVLKVLYYDIQYVYRCIPFANIKVLYKNYLNDKYARALQQIYLYKNIIINVFTLCDFESSIRKKCIVYQYNK